MAIRSAFTAVAWALAFAGCASAGSKTIKVSSTEEAFGEPSTLGVSVPSDEVADLHAFLPDTAIPRLANRDQLAPHLLNAGRYLPCTALADRALWFLEDDLAFDPVVGAFLSRRKPDGGCWYEVGLERLAMDVRVREGNSERAHLTDEPIVGTQWGYAARPNEVALDSRTLELVVSMRDEQLATRTRTSAPEALYAAVASVWIGAESGFGSVSNVHLLRAQSTAVGPNDQVWLTWLGDYVDYHDRFFSIAVMSHDGRSEREQRITKAHRLELPFGIVELDARLISEQRDDVWRVERRVRASLTVPAEGGAALADATTQLWPELKLDAVRVTGSGPVPIHVDDGEYSATAEVRPVRSGGHVLVVMLSRGDRQPRALFVRHAASDERPVVTLALAQHGALREVELEVGDTESVAWLCEPALGPPITLYRRTRRPDADGCGGGDAGTHKCVR